MNQTTKYIAMFAILPLVAVAMLPGYIGDADAVKAKNDTSVGHLDGARSYGSATQAIVCGGALCSDAAANATPISLPETPDIRE